MAFSKKTSFDNRQSKIAGFANALSHPARIAILETLAKRKRCICGEIVEVLPLAQSTVSQHLKELREIGLIKGEINGPRSCYCIDRDKWGEMVKEIEKFFDEIINCKTDQECC
jgi:ArsR family transcriptional regulator